jgi:serine/threonine protein kinase
MGIVYRGRQVTLDRVVAVKVLLEDLAHDTSFVERFTRESRVAAALNHPNIIHIYDAGQSENLLYFAMEYISGPTIAHLLKQKGRLPVQNAVDIAAQVASALDYAHAEAQLVHRDVKPENIMLDRWGNVKVVDFGLARVAGSQGITRVGAVVGSLYYVPPEQLFGQKPDGRSDVYSLGVALYEMLTSQRPFRGQSLGELSHAIVSGPLTLPSKLESSVPADLEAIILKALERDRERRFRTAGEFESELRRWLSAHPPQEHKPSPTPRKAPAPLPAKAPGGTGGLNPVAARPPALPKPRPGPSAPVITLPSISQVQAEPSPTLSPVERPARPTPKLVPNLPSIASVPNPPTTANDVPRDAEAENEALEEEEPTAGELIKDAASQLYQRFVSRLKKE